MARETNIHAGHRAAMRRKFLSVGATAFHPHELIEMLLYYSIPLCDTNPTAHRLLETLGGMDRLLLAEPSALTAVPGVGASSARLLSMLHGIGVRAEASLAELDRRETDDLEDYLLSSYRGEPLELLLLDAGNRLIERVALPSSEKVFTSRSAVESALCHRASTAALVVYRNGRTLECADDDLEGLCMLRDALTLVGVRLADCILVSGRYIQRIARTSPEFVYPDPDIASTFRLPRKTEEQVREKDTEHLLGLLSYARVKDRETAEGLLDRFGSFGALFSTPAEELIRFGLSEQAAILISLVTAIYARAEIASCDVAQPLDTAERQADFLARRYIGVRDERLTLLLLNERSEVIDCIPFSEGAVGGTMLDLRRIVELSLRYRAASAVLAHNHPGGTLSPSPEDVCATRSVDHALSAVGITLDEHYVLVGRRFTPIRLYSDQMLTVRPPEFYGEDSFAEVHRSRAGVRMPFPHYGLRENEP